jgi:hypothetical protein
MIDLGSIGSNIVQVQVLPIVVIIGRRFSPEGLVPEGSPSGTRKLLAKDFPETRLDAFLGPVPKGRYPGNDLTGVSRYPVSTGSS